MRINEPSYVVPGDVICCPSCHRRLSIAKRFILKDEKILEQDLQPIENKWLIRAGSPMVCYECGEQLTKSGRFKIVERFAKPHNSTDPK
jgi:hypothetical protein